MASKIKVIDALQTSPPNPTLSKIVSWNPAENPPPDELIRWLTELEEKTVAPYGNGIVEQLKRTGDPELLKDAITTSDYVQLKRAESALHAVLCPFLDVLTDAHNVLEGLTAGRVSDAFTQGVRIGMLFEKLVSVADGRYQRKLYAEEKGRRAAEKTNAKKAETRPDYMSGVKRRMDAGEKYHPACQKEADEHGVDKKTVVAHTGELAPRGNRKND